MTGRLRRADRDARPALELLTTLPAATLVTASLTLQARTPGDHPGTFCLAPVVDGVVLPERPLEAIRAGRGHRVPLIIGTNDREGSIFRGRIDILPRSPVRMRAVFGAAPLDARVRMRATYPGLPKRHPAADFAGDFGFWFPSVATAERHSRVAPVHMYRFDEVPVLMHLVGLDATHGIELYPLFEHTRVPLVRAMGALGGRQGYTDAGRRMRQYWLAFAKTGTVPVNWPQYDPIDRATLIFDRVDRVESDPRSERRVVWEAFLPRI